MNIAIRIIDLLGGTRPAARALGRPASTVQSWKVRGLIPAQDQPKVLAAARALGVDLQPADFFPPADSVTTMPAAAEVGHG
jgi:hypothetical protein